MAMEAPLSFTTLDPLEDTERFWRTYNADGKTSFTTLDPLEDTERPRSLPVDHIRDAVSPRSIRLRILKEDKPCNQYQHEHSFTTLDPLEDTERVIIAGDQCRCFEFHHARSA